MVTLLVILILIGLVVGGWHLFELLWDRRNFRAPEGEGRPVRNLHVSQAREVYDDIDDLVPVDVRSARAWRNGRIPRAVNTPFSCRGAKFDGEALDAIDRDAHLLVYCDGGFRSRCAVSAVRERGFQNVYHLNRGLLAWKFLGNPVESGPADSPPRHEEDS